MNKLIYVCVVLCLFQTGLMNISLDHLKSQLVLDKVDTIAIFFFWDEESDLEINWLT